MAEITAAMVKELREKTDAPMMECKKALAEAGGDMAKAEEILRVKLGSKATQGGLADRGRRRGRDRHRRRRQDRRDRRSQLRDRLRREERRLHQFAKDLAALVVAKNPADVAGAFARCRSAAGTVETTRTALIGKIGENINVRRFARLQAKGALANYVHGGSKIGVLLD